MDEHMSKLEQNRKLLNDMINKNPELSSTDIVSQSKIVDELVIKEMLKDDKCERRKNMKRQILIPKS